MSARLHEQFDAQALLMAAISHDLRTPLARLRLRLEQMSTQPQAERCIADVQEMDKLIGSVLEMMRGGHDTSAHQRIDVRSLLQSLVDDLAEQGSIVGLADAPSGENPVLVLAQPAALNRIFGNLIGNALRHGGSAQVAISVQDGQAHVTIDDTGPGIAPDQLAAVFRPFYRVDPGRGRAGEGSGLGLYIARDLTERNGGRLTLANRASGGLRAEVVMPVVSTTA